MFFGACATTTELGVFDDSVPEDQLCLLEVHDYMAIILFNNMPVKWTGDGRFRIYLPPGEHSFTLVFDDGSVLLTVLLMEEVSFTHTRSVTKEFIPGHSYRFDKKKFLGIPFVGIKDITPKK